MRYIVIKFHFAAVLFSLKGKCDSEEILIRLDKYLAEMSVGTRSEVKKIIRTGRVTVNDETVKKPEQKVDISKDIVYVDGNIINYTEYEYFMLNKPAGYVSATTDREHKTVIDLIDDSSHNDLFPVGRLDIDTEGLLIITNDGGLSHRLLSPKHHVDKKYFLLTKREVTEEDVDILESGVDIGDEKTTLPAKVSDISYKRWNDIGKYHDKIKASKEFCSEDISGGFTSLCLTIHEGRYHQVKRMMNKIGKPVVYLKRLSMGKLVLDENLALGEYRILTEDELKLLKGS